MSEIERLNDELYEALERVGQLEGDLMAAGAEIEDLRHAANVAGADAQEDSAAVQASYDELCELLKDVGRGLRTLGEVIEASRTLY